MDLRVKEILKSKGMNLQDLADKMGIHRVSLSKSINGNPTLETLRAIANSLDVDLIELFKSTDKWQAFYTELEGKRDLAGYIKK